MTCRERLEQIFNELGVPYTITAHRPVYTAQDVASAEHISGYQVAKVVMVLAGDELLTVVVPAPHRVDLERVKAALGVRTARLATEGEFAGVFPDCEVGAMPPFGNLYGRPVYVDRSLTLDPEIVFNAGTHRETMTISYADFERIARPRVVDIILPPRRATMDQAVGR